MRNTASITTLGIALALSGCATGPYGASRNNSGNRTLVGVAAGTAVGAAAGAALGGGVLAGGVVGAVAGGLIGAVVKPSSGKPRVYQRDTNGACYYVDKNGRPIYDPKASC